MNDHPHDKKKIIQPKKKKRLSPLFWIFMPLEIF